MQIVKRTSNLSLKRSVESGTAEQRETVQAIISAVRERGDQAIKEFTKRFDAVDLEQMAVTQQEIVNAVNTIDSDMVDVMKEAAQNIEDFHAKQRRNSWMNAKES